jgi:hypothetical protein
MTAFTTWLGQHTHLWAVALLIALVVWHYLTRFVIPAKRLQSTLAQAIEGLSSVQASTAQQGVDLEQIGQNVMADPRLAHLWRQYAHGLHPYWGEGQSRSPASVQQSRVQALSETFFAAMKAKTGTAVVNLSNIEQQVLGDARLASLWAEYSEALQGMPATAPTEPARVKQWRSTALAETYFSEHALVDSPLQTDFYKHVPGILTGLGIIGTFSGLIMGLIHFDVSNPETTQAQLSLLVQTVGQAFFVSAAAITLAMLFTWIEKSLLTARYAQVETLQHQIDSLFEGSSGEAYLERLVAAAEAQAAASHEMLKEMRRTLSELSGK